MFRTSRDGPIAVSPGSPESFVPLVPASTGTPRCEILNKPPAQMGAQVVSFVYADPPERRVTVTLDEGGIPINYSDLRGDLITSDDHQGDFTAISVNLIQGRALAHNRPASGKPEAITFSLQDALSSVTLGDPQTMLEKVLSTCRTVRPLPGPQIIR